MKKNSATLTLPPVPPPASVKIIAVSDTLYTVGFSPDTHCGAGYKALIGHPNVATSSMFVASTTYVRPDNFVIGTGAEIVATPSLLATGIFQHKNGDYVDSQSGAGTTYMGPPSISSVATNTNTCNDWTSTATSGFTNYVGTTISTNSEWAANGYRGGCNTTASLYCIQQ